MEVKINKKIHNCTESMFCKSLSCNFIDFVIFTCADDGYQYVIIPLDVLMDDAGEQPEVLLDWADIKSPSKII